MMSTYSIKWLSIALGICFFFHFPCFSESSDELFYAQSLGTYLERDAYLRQLTQQTSEKSPIYAEAWYLRGLNDFEEALASKEVENAMDADKMFERAAVSLEKASLLLKTKTPRVSAQALLLQARAYELQTADKSRYKAIQVLDKLWANNQELLQVLSDPLEAHLLYGLMANACGENEKATAIVRLQQGIHDFPSSPKLAMAFQVLGTLFYNDEEYAQAEEAFVKLANLLQSDRELTAEAYYRASQCADKLHKDLSVVQNYRKTIVDRYPESAIAPEASFTLYSYQEYLQGNRVALKHLNAFPEKYPDSPFALNALFLIGLDNKRDRRSVERKWLRKKNLNQAIDYFQAVESFFERLYVQKKIPPSQMEHYLLIRYRAHLEKGLANYNISMESEGAKKLIYQEFAQEILNKLWQDLREENHPEQQWMVNKTPFWNLQEECAYWLSQAYLTSQDFKEAEKILATMLEQYKALKITRGYFLSKTWFVQGTIAMQKKDYELALECFLRAEDTSKGKLMSADERLNLLIQQSLCLKELNQLEKSILILSNVINDDAVSSVRIQAMLLRAEIYAKQGRHELARKQLEATARNGGEWASIAKEKLKNDR